MNMRNITLLLLALLSGRIISMGQTTCPMAKDVDGNTYLKLGNAVRCLKRKVGNEE